MDTFCIKRYVIQKQVAGIVVTGRRRMIVASRYRGATSAGFISAHRSRYAVSNDVVTMK
ncbi:MAG: hypothetical protein H7315_01185 [Herminiimonas sp.]|nr:hypothetical protein [Herminiimonas sp.]